MAPIENGMARSAVPSIGQIETLLYDLERKRFLATGHARTSHARDRTRRAWQEIAFKLNRDTSGCFKNWQQWAKYWKDKKGAVKRKSSLVRMAMIRTGETGEEQETYLSPIEERIIAIMNGECFVAADREQSPDEAANALSEGNISDPEPLDTVLWSLQDPLKQENARLGTERILQDDPDSSRRNIKMENQPNEDQMIEDVSLPGPHSSSQNAAASSRRRRMLTARRRLLQSTPQSLTERFLAIEEKRLEIEQTMAETQKTLADNQKKMFELFLEFSGTMARQTQSLQDLCQATRAVAENKNNL